MPADRLSVFSSESRVQVRVRRAVPDGEIARNAQHFERFGKRVFAVGLRFQIEKAENRAVYGADSADGSRMDAVQSGAGEQGRDDLLAALQPDDQYVAC